MKLLPWMACALVALVALPALAAGGSRAVDGAFVTWDNGFNEVGQPETDTTVNITPGGRVTFSYPEGGSVHNVVFEDGREPDVVHPDRGGCGQPDRAGAAVAAELPGPGLGGLLHLRRGRHVSLLSAASTRTWWARSWSGRAPRRRRRPPRPRRRPPRRHRDGHSHGHGHGDRDRDRRPIGAPHGGARRRRSAGVLVAGRVEPDAPRQQRDDQGRRAGHVRVPDRQATSTTSRSTEPAPASCPQTKASPGGSLDTNDAPPMPGTFNNGWGPGWEGYCTFPNVGTYTLICQVHSSDMRGTIIVEPVATATPTATATATATTRRPRRPHARRRRRPRPPRRPRRPQPQPRRPRPPRPRRDRHRGATPTPTDTTPGPTTQTLPAAPGPAPAAKGNPQLKVAAATLKRKARTFTVSGTIAGTATGKVRVVLTYRSARRSARRR